MRGFRREPDGSLTARIRSEEQNVLITLASQVSDLLDSPHAADPALRRLLPDAYRDDPESAAEFRRLTEDSLAERKRGNAQILIASLDGVESVRLDARQAQAWLRSLTDIRLTLAARLGIEHDGDTGDDPTLHGVYEWLGFVQGSLVEAVAR
jgi:hypothetical protein